MALAGYTGSSLPEITRGTKSPGKSMDCGNCGVEWETGEIGVGGNNGIVTSVEVFYDV